MVSFREAEKYKKRKRFKNNGRPSSRKWLDHARGLVVNFRPKARSRTTVPVVTCVRAPEKGDGVECLECGVRLSQLASHINRVHTMSGREYREKHGADAPLVDADHLALYTQICVERGIRKHQVNTYICKTCGTLFRRGRSKNAPDDAKTGRRRYCSDACTTIALQKNGVTQGASHATFSPARIEYVERMKRERAARCTTVCVVCGRSFESPTLRHGPRARARFRGTCSMECRSKLKAQERSAHE